MLQPKLILLSLVIGVASSPAIELPEAQYITDQLLDEKSNQVKRINPAEIYLKRVKEVEGTEARVKLWLDTYITWARSLSRTSDWEERERFARQIEEIGRYFPKKREWPILNKLLNDDDGAYTGSKTEGLKFLIALLQGDEATAIQMLPTTEQENEPNGKAANKGITGALIGLSNSSGSMGYQRLLPIYELAVKESSMPQLQRKAYAEIIHHIEQNPNRYYSEVPDLTQLYKGKALDAQIARLVNALGDNLRPHRLPRNMVSPVYAYIRAHDMVPNEGFLDYLDESSPTYSDDIAYYNDKREDLPATEQSYRIRISNALKSRDVEEAWKQWEAFAAADSKQAGNFIKSIFGYQSRNYPSETLQAIAVRLLEVGESPELLEILQSAMPLEAGKNDPLLARIRKLEKASSGSVKEIAYRKLEWDRLLSLGLHREASAAVQSILTESDRFLELLKSKNQTSSLIKYARAMDLIEEPELAGAIIELQKEALDTLENYQRQSLVGELATYYSQKGDDLAAYNQLKSALHGVTRNTLEQGRVNIVQTLALLTGLYTKNGQHQDAVHLLDHAIGWRAKDLKNVSIYNRDQIFEVDAAVSLHAIGRSHEARSILRDYLRYENNSADSAYKALIEIEGAAAGDFFRELAKEAPFEERPLIWQAVLLKDSGELEAAEEMARQAISIDPSDGEMNANNRLRAYAVLADILKARNNEEAEVFENVVAAVDLSEIADEYRTAGLHLDALRLYQESLALFADAYCVRFRAAVELEAAGQHADAEKHFEAAYTLMPDQFGRIESHCFGCEGAFEGERAETVAERVFTRMLAKRPEQASLHYLMGYLNESRNRPEDAVQNFKKAVELDPLYYNAWSHLRNLAARTSDHALGLKATKAMLEIAPSRTLGSLGGLTIAQTGQLWGTLESVLPIMPERSEQVYPLKASARMIEESGTQNFDNWRSSKDYQTAGSLFFLDYEIKQFLTESLNASNSRF
ncbi:hypothetical protein DDZ13_11515 [Coraliomargarita sinensis]|uniref:Tetratricopeptide repeat protein n=1 Tax=Coraliomargarita sinensis TaxID=2174842 RepID=A0A317ZJQ9_9BACT|nr:hypothetical protein [Coraliomargarita sinensis]PXA03601.1 hypothetical protein DDZ13_11515 [Coraliomargarita sinensis]